MKVKLIKLLDEVGDWKDLDNNDLTIGQTYEVIEEYSNLCTEPNSVWIIDDAGDENEIYEGEYEVVDEE